MKQPGYFLIIVLAISILYGCKKEKESFNSTHGQSAQVSDHKVELAELDIEAYKLVMKANQERLELLGNNAARGECMSTVTVPIDYSTIQEAVDMVCDSGTVIVNAGTYSEYVIVSKPGLQIEADDGVILNGAFNLDANAAKTIIDGFEINGVVPDGSFPACIFVFDADGAEIINNSLTGEEYGISCWNVDKAKIKGNHVFNTGWGITFSTAPGQTCHKNKITNNTVTGITYASGIGLQGDCDHNTIQGNEVTNCTHTANAGIFINSSETTPSEYNTIRNNISNNNAYGGFRIIYDGAYNKIGPNNEFNGNSRYGIFFHTTPHDNTITKNDIIGNTPCDIIDLTDGKNTYRNNNYDCFSDVVILP